MCNRRRTRLLGYVSQLDRKRRSDEYCTNPPCCFDSRAKDRLRAVLHYFGSLVKTNAYIDGFNLYYGCFKHDPSLSPSKWLDLRALCQALLPADQIHRVHYFTAMVSQTTFDKARTNPGL